MKTLNTYTVSYQVTILEDGMTSKQFHDYGHDTCVTDMDMDEFQSSSDTKAKQYAEQKYNGFKTIDGEKVFLLLETIWAGDMNFASAGHPELEQYL